MLTGDELGRYDRQIMIRGFGREGQEKLKRARIFIAGAGGLCSAVATYLAAAGVGVMRIVDHDRVELSNLNRQVFHWDEDLGKGKAASAIAKLRRLNPGVKLEAIEAMITGANAAQLVSGFDLIVDATDNLPARFLLNKVALQKKIPLFHGAVYGFEGRVMTVLPGESACLRCVYHGLIPEEKIPVIGVTPAIVGCIQATEVIKYIVGMGHLLTNRLLDYNGLDMKFTEFRVKRDPDCEQCGRSIGD